MGQFKNEVYIHPKATANFKKEVYEMLRSDTPAKLDLLAAKIMVEEKMKVNIDCADLTDDSSSGASLVDLMAALAKRTKR